MLTRENPRSRHNEVSLPKKKKQNKKQTLNAFFLLGYCDCNQHSQRQTKTMTYLQSLMHALIFAFVVTVFKWLL